MIDMLVTENIFLSNNRQDRAVRNLWLRRMLTWRLVDGVITGKDTDNDIGKYTANLYENGYFNAKTHIDVDCYTVNQNQNYEVGFPCRCILSEENDAFLVHSGSVMLIEVASGTWTNRMGGWPASYDPATSTIKGLVSGDRATQFFVKTGSDEDTVFPTIAGEFKEWVPFEGSVDEGNGLLAGTLVSGGVGTSLPVPQYAGQVLGATADLQLGAFFSFLHPIPLG
jgi:hypothetical protein